MPVVMEKNTLQTTDVNKLNCYGYDHRMNWTMDALLVTIYQ